MRYKVKARTVAWLGGFMPLGVPSVLELTVVLENSNVEKLASHLYLSVHSLPQEDHNDTDNASSGQVDTILMPESTVCVVQSAWRRQHHASVLDRHPPADRTAALHRMRPGVLRTGGPLEGPQ